MSSWDFQSAKLLWDNCQINWEINTLASCIYSINMQGYFEQDWHTKGLYFPRENTKIEKEGCTCLGSNTRVITFFVTRPTPGQTFHKRESYKYTRQLQFATVAPKTQEKMQSWQTDRNLIMLQYLTSSTPWGCWCPWPALLSLRA